MRQRGCKAEAVKPRVRRHKAFLTRDCEAIRLLKYESRAVRL